MNGTLRWLGQCMFYSLIAYVYNRRGEYLPKRRLLSVGLVAVPAALTGGHPPLQAALAGVMITFYADGLVAILPALWRARPWGVRA
jgi:hypothetical protein